MVSDALTAFRVVVLNGPRQSGKSTMLRSLETVAAFTTLDDRQSLRSARTDPSGFVDAYPRPLVIDEVQRGGDPLVLAIKAAVDRRHTEPGQFLLAGSSRFLTVPQLSESLAGRARIIDLWPLSQGEIERRTIGSFIDDLMTGPDAVRGLEPDRLRREEVLDRVVRGGFPEAHRIKESRHRAGWFHDYVETLIRRDLTELSRIRSGVDLRRFVTLLAGRSAQEVNIAALARHAELGEDATRAYLALFETIYLVHQLPSWSNSATTRAKRRPKLHFVDSGVAADLLQASVEALRQPTSTIVGALLETFVASELARNSTWATQRIRLSHFRDRDKREIDIIAETADGRIAGVEVKAAIDVDESDFRHLIYLRDRLGDRFVNGVVFHFGERPLPFGDRLTALPVSALWT
jgi:uncharacterized protein